MILEKVDTRKVYECKSHQLTSVKVDMSINALVFVENVIKEIKKILVIGAIYCNTNWELSSIVELFAGFTQRRA